MLRTRDSEIQKFKLLTRVKAIYSENGKVQNQSFRQAVIFSKPSQLKIESIPLNTAYSFNILISNNGQTAFFDVPEKKGYSW